MIRNEDIDDCLTLLGVDRQFKENVFQFFDREPQDNTIEKEELINAMRCFGLNPRPQEVKELLTQYDHDGKNSNQKGESSSCEQKMTLTLVECESFISTKNFTCCNLKTLGFKTLLNV